MHHDPMYMGAAVRLALSAIALYAAIELIVEPTLNEGSRQRIFRLRRELFLYMARGGIDPKNRLYTDLRSTMNGALRFAERMTMARMLFLSLFFRTKGAEYRRRMDDSLASLPEEQRVAMSGFRDQLMITIGLHLVGSSLLGWLLVVPLAAMILVSTLARTLTGKARDGANIARDALRRIPTDAIEADAECLSEQLSVVT